MKLLSIVLFFCLSCVWAQPAAKPAPNLPARTVIATFGDGQKLTFGELKRFMGFLPPNMQQMALRDRKRFVEQYVLMHRLAEMAEKNKLDQESPTSDQLAFNRMYVLMNAQINKTMTDIQVPEADQRKFYDEHKDEYSQVKVKVIYVSFASNPSANSENGKTYRSEEEAKGKIEDLRKQLLGGADFVKLVKENSEDKTSAAKDGDFGSIRRSDNIPEAIRVAIFALKPGEISPPVRQPNGYYLFRAEEVNQQPFEEVKADIANKIKQQRFKGWMDETSQSLNVKFENQEFFEQNAAPQAPPAASAPAPGSIPK